MKSVVYKYLIPFQEGFELTLPKGSQIVRIDNDQGNPYLWALVPLEEKETVTFKFQSSKTGGVMTHEIKNTCLELNKKYSYNLPNWMTQVSCY